MKIVLDTNVFISGIFFTGPPYLILRAWQDGKIELVVSPDILDEYIRVGDILADHYPNIDLTPVLDYVIRNAVVHIAKPLPGPVSEDPDDDKFIACALASEATIIISGDKHLLNLSGYYEIEILKPREFVDKYLNL